MNRARLHAAEPVRHRHQDAQFGRARVRLHQTPEQAGPGRRVQPRSQVSARLHEQRRRQVGVAQDRPLASAGINGIKQTLEVIISGPSASVQSGDLN